MRSLFAYTILFSLVALTGSLAQEKKAATPPAKPLVFQAKNGNIAYDHSAHAKREKNDCKVCHPALWPQDAHAPLNFKGGAMHKAATDSKTSCALCHYEGGKAFAAKGNCTGKCHNNAKKG